MPSVVEKLNYKGQKEIAVVAAPRSFEPELAPLARGVKIHRSLDRVKDLEFVLAFVTSQREVDDVAKAVAVKTKGDAIVWLAYPKGSSKRYKSEINRDSGWRTLGAAGFEGVRLIAIDEDWSALRFRRVEYIKTMKRAPTRSLSAAGRTKTARV